MTILFSLEPPGPPRPTPPDIPDKWRFGERRVGFLAAESLPSLDWLGIDVREIEMADDELDELADAHDAAFGDEIQHRIGGYPSELQDEQMALTCELQRRGLSLQPGEAVAPAVARAARDWRLLMKFDSDDSLGMDWWRGGRVYIFVRRADARRGDFSRTVTITQID